MSLGTIIYFFAPLFAFAAAGYAYLFFVFVPKEAKKHGITDPQKVVDYRDALLKGPAQLGAGFLAVISLVFTIGAGIATFRQSADQEANQQFFKAAQMAITGLDDSKTGPDDSNATATAASEELRVAANYALRKIVLQHPEYCDMVTSILLDQIDKNTKTQETQETQQNQWHERINPNVSAAAFVLGEIPLCESDHALRLTDQYLVGANFGNSPFLRGADLRGSTLWAAYFGFANLDNTRFDGAAMGDDDLDGEGFEKARADEDTWEYRKYGYIINFDNATLRCATFLNTSLAGASFVNADLYHTDFRNTRLDGVDFRGARNFNTVDLENACFDPTQKPKVDTAMLDFFKNGIKRQDCGPPYPEQAKPKTCNDVWSWVWK